MLTIVQFDAEHRAGQYGRYGAFGLYRLFHRYLTWTLAGAGYFPTTGFRSLRKPFSDPTQTIPGIPSSFRTYMLAGQEGDARASSRRFPSFCRSGFIGGPDGGQFLEASSSTRRIQNPAGHKKIAF